MSGLSGFRDCDLLLRGSLFVAFGQFRLGVFGDIGAVAYCFLGGFLIFGRSEHPVKPTARIFIIILGLFF